MAVVDLSLSSDALAESISSSAAAVVTRLSIKPKETVYVVGNAADFDEFCVPAMKLLGTKSAACLWPTVSKSRAFRNYFDVFFVQEYIEPLPKRAHLVLLQSVLLVAQEAIAMLTRVIAETAVPARISIGSCIGHHDVEAEITRYFKTAYKLDVRVISEEYLPSDRDFLDFEHHAFDLLDDRPNKRFPNMPEWVLSKMLGRDHDPSPDAGSDPSGGPSSGNDDGGAALAAPQDGSKALPSYPHLRTNNRVEKQDEEQDPGDHFQSEQDADSVDEPRNSMI
jgi:hypothetical protein